MDEPRRPEEKARVAANLRVSLHAGLAGSALGVAANLLSGKARNAVPLVALCGLCLVALWLLRRGRARAAALVLLGALLGTVHAMLMIGQGVHDRTALVYPVIILVAALLLELYVRDNGIGIEPPHQALVIELFHRLDPRIEGTGLGLALARRIVETHGGRIWVESAGTGRGSTFCFSLPSGTGPAGREGLPSGGAPVSEPA